MIRNRTAVASILLLGTFALAADEALSPEQLKQLQTDKNWSELLKATTKALALKGPAAEKFSRPELWMLKAEAQLQQKQFVPASDSFTKASEEATATPEQKDQATAYAQLMRKCDARGYRPPVTKETPSPQPIDVTDPAARVTALRTYFDAELIDAKAELEKEKKKPSIADLVKVAKTAAQLPPLERAANSADEKSKELINEIQQLAADTVTKWTETAQARVETIRKEANVLIPSSRKIVGGGQAYQKAGLSGQHRQDLQAIMKECGKIAGSYKSMVQIVGVPNEALEAVPKTVETLHDDADRVFNTDYTDLYRK